MNKVFCFVVSIIIAVSGYGQKVVPGTDIIIFDQAPPKYQKLYISPEYPNLKVDNFLYIPYRDTNFVPDRPGAIVKRPDDQANNRVYVWGGYSWTSVGGDTASNSLNFAAKADTSTINPQLRLIQATKTDSVTVAKGSFYDTIKDWHAGTFIVRGFIYKHDGLLDGGVVTWSRTGLTFDVTAAVYSIGQIPESSLAGQVTLPPADPTYGSKYVIYLDNTGHIGYLQSSPGTYAITPQVNSATQLKLTDITVAAGATTPQNVSSNLIYDEGNKPPEWNVVPNGITANAANITFPQSGATDISTNGWVNGSSLSFQTSSFISLASYNTLQFWIRLKTAVPATSGMTVTFFNNDVAATSSIPVTFDRSLVGAYQNITVSLADINTILPTANTITIGFSGSASAGAFFDNVQLQNGINNSGTGTQPITLTTVGTSGPATLVNGVLNVPDYATTGGGTTTDTLPLHRQDSILATKKLTALSVTGTNTKTITATLADASTVTATFTDLQGSGGVGTEADPLSVHVADSAAMLSPYARKSTLATVATSGSYNDLSDKPVFQDAIDTTSLSNRINKAYNNFVLLNDSSGVRFIKGDGTPDTLKIQGGLTANQPITVTATGDATGTSITSGTSPSLPLTLATVNSNVGTFGSTTAVPVITTDAKGRITAVTTATISAGGGGTGGVDTTAVHKTGDETIRSGIKTFNNQIVVGGARVGTSINNDFTSTMMGVGALNAYTGTANGSNTVYGHLAGALINSGNGNVLSGEYSGYPITTGSSNSIFGTNGMSSATNADKNSGVGWGIFQSATGGNNSGVGIQAGRVSAGYGVFLGAYSGYNETGYNKLYINNGTIGGLIVGDFSTGQVQINTDKIASQPASSNLTSAASFEVYNHIATTQRGALSSPRMTAAQRDQISVQSGQITKIILTNTGTATSAPTVTISGSGTGATATATYAGGSYYISVTNPGSGYTANSTTVTITGGGSTGATAYAVVGAQGVSVYCLDCTADDGQAGVVQYFRGTSWKNAW